MEGDGDAKCVVQDKLDSVEVARGEEGGRVDLDDLEPRLLECVCCDCGSDDPKLVVMFSSNLVSSRCAILPVNALISETDPSAQATARTWPVSREEGLKVSSHYCPSQEINGFHHLKNSSAGDV